MISKAGTGEGLVSYDIMLEEGAARTRRGDFKQERVALLLPSSCTVYYPTLVSASSSSACNLVLHPFEDCYAVHVYMKCLCGQVLILLFIQIRLCGKGHCRLGREMCRSNIVYKKTACQWSLIISPQSLLTPRCNESQTMSSE